MNIRHAMKLKPLILLLLLGACSRAHVRATDAALESRSVARPALWAGLTPGKHAVGYARHVNASGVVPVWYPARASALSMTIREYLAADTARLTGFLTQAKVSDSTVRTLLANRMFAMASAPQSDERFPLVLVAQGNGHDVFEQVVLCEYLASYGFVVATTPSPMLRTPMTSVDEVGPMAAQQATELSLAIGTVAAAYRVDTARIGVVGHSFGARAALLLAMNDSRVKALVSLDGGIGTATAAASFSKVPAFKSGVSLPPLLHFYEELDEFMKPDFSLMRGLRFESTSTVRYEGMHHVHFSTYGLAVHQFRDLATLTRAVEVTAHEAAASYRASKDFLEPRLRPSN